jgi:phage terminase large subunit-like protein
MDRWLACRADLSPEDLIGRECYGGLDMSSNIDLTAFTLVFPCADGSVDVLAYHWLPRDVLAERAKTDFDRYPQLVAEGYLELTDGDYIDQPYIRQRIRELGGMFKIKEVAYDPTFASDLGPKLAADGFEVFEFWQTHRMFSPVMAKLDALTRAGQIRHRNPLLDWQASHLEARTNEQGHMKPAKPSAGKKIDGMVSLLMALGNVVKGEKREVEWDESPLIWLGPEVKR